MSMTLETDPWKAFEWLEEQGELRKRYQLGRFGFTFCDLSYRWSCGCQVDDFLAWLHNGPCSLKVCWKHSKRSVAVFPLLQGGYLR